MGQQRYQTVTNTVSTFVSTIALSALYPLQIDFYRVRLNSDGITKRIEWIGSSEYLGTQAQTTVTVTFDPDEELVAGDEIVAIATDGGNNSSELSNPTLVV